MTPHDPILAPTYQRLVQSLTMFSETMQVTQPAGTQAERWSRAGALLQQELGRLRSLGSRSPATAAERDAQARQTLLKNTVTRLTQLARAQDGLPLDHAGSGEQLATQRRSVVLAAWQLLQSLEQQAPQKAATGAR